MHKNRFSLLPPHPVRVVAPHGTYYGFTGDTKELREARSALHEREIRTFFELRHADNNRYDAQYVLCVSPKYENRYKELTGTALEGLPEVKSLTKEELLDKMQGNSLEQNLAWLQTKIAQLPTAHTPLLIRNNSYQTGEFSNRHLLSMAFDSTVPASLGALIEVTLETIAQRGNIPMLEGIKTSTGYSEADVSHPDFVKGYTLIENALRGASKHVPLKTILEAKHARGEIAQVGTRKSGQAPALGVALKVRSYEEAALFKELFREHAIKVSDARDDNDKLLLRVRTESTAKMRELLPQGMSVEDLPPVDGWHDVKSPPERGR